MFSDNDLDSDSETDYQPAAFVKALNQDSDNNSTEDEDFAEGCVWAREPPEVELQPLGEETKGKKVSAIQRIKQFLTASEKKDRADSQKLYKK